MSTLKKGDKVIAACWPGIVIVVEGCTWDTGGADSRYNCCSVDSRHSGSFREGDLKPAEDAAPAAPLSYVCEHAPWCSLTCRGRCPQHFAPSQLADKLHCEAVPGRTGECVVHLALIEAPCPWPVGTRVRQRQCHTCVGDVASRVTYSACAECFPVILDGGRAGDVLSACNPAYWEPVPREAAVATAPYPPLDPPWASFDIQPKEQLAHNKPYCVLCARFRGRYMPCSGVHETIANVLEAACEHFILKASLQPKEAGPAVYAPVQHVAEDRSSTLDMLRTSGIFLDVPCRKHGRCYCSVCGGDRQRSWAGMAVRVPVKRGIGKTSM